MWGTDVQQKVQLDGSATKAGGIVDELYGRAAQLRKRDTGCIKMDMIGFTMELKVCSVESLEGCLWAWPGASLGIKVSLHCLQMRMLSTLYWTNPRASRIGNEMR
jgi:hypothetical protein